MQQPRDIASQVVNTTTTPTGAPLALDKFCADSGISPTTAWRIRKRGWLQTINICGRHYITPEALAMFTRRAEAGEFAKPITNPRELSGPVAEIEMQEAR